MFEVKLTLFGINSEYGYRECSVRNGSVNALNVFLLTFWTWDWTVAKEFAHLVLKDCINPSGCCREQGHRVFIRFSCCWNEELICIGPTRTIKALWIPRLRISNALISDPVSGPVQLLQILKNLNRAEHF